MIWRTSSPLKPSRLYVMPYPGLITPAYRAIASDLTQQGGVSSDTLTWYSKAALINDSSSQSATSLFARFYVQQKVFAETSTVITVVGANSDFQRESDRLAVDVLNAVDQSDGVVKGFDQVGIQDTQN